MTSRETKGRSAGWRSTAALAVSVLALAGCDSLLDVDLPSTIDESELDSPAYSALLVRSTIAQLECAYSRFVSGNAAGNEDVFQAGGDDMQGAAEYEHEVGFGNFCSSGGDDGFDWFDPFQSTRFLGEDTYNKLTNWTDDEVLAGLEGELGDRQQAMALTAIYTAIPFEIFGTYLCEISFDSGPLVTARESLDSAEVWVTRAIDLIDAMAGGDFDLPDDYDIIEDPGVGGARAFAYGLRARIRWAMNDPATEAGALSDLAEVPMDFVARVTRGGGDDDIRENDVWRAHTEEAFLPMVEDPIDWWAPSGGRTNPVTSMDWPDPIPFTGYAGLAIEDATGRAIDANQDAFFSGTGNTDDVRVPVSTVCTGFLFRGRCIGGEFVSSANKYTSADDPIPLLSWQEMWLIRAELDPAMAIDLVNDLRDAAGLPQVQGQYITDLTDGTNDASEIEDMIIEERRRQLWLEGRYWATKIRNTDKLWFPRGDGQNENGIDLGGAVRMLMQEFEFDTNPNLDLSQRNTGCPVDERATVTG